MHTYIIVHEGIVTNEFEAKNSLAAYREKESRQAVGRIFVKVTEEEIDQELYNEYFNA